MGTWRCLLGDVRVQKDCGNGPHHSIGPGGEGAKVGNLLFVKSNGSGLLLGIKMGKAVKNCQKQG